MDRDIMGRDSQTDTNMNDFKGQLTKNKSVENTVFSFI